VTAFAFEPELEAGAGAEREPVEELVPEAREGDGLHPGAAFEDVDVHERGRPQLQRKRVTADLRVVAEAASQGRERPAKRAERIVGLWKEEAGQALARRRLRGAQQIGEEAPCLLPARSLDGRPVALHPRGAE
jgi:hypothetical protein